MPAVLQRDFGKRRPPKRVKLPGGEVLYPASGQGSSLATVETDSAASVNELLGLGWELVSGDPGPAGGRVFRGSWSADRAYREGDVVLSGEKTWRRTSTQGSPSAAPPGEGWERVTVFKGAGSTIRSGTGAPAASLGLDGEFWLDTSGSGKLYGPRAGGSWGQGFALGGVKGYTVHIKLGTTQGVATYELGRSDLPTDPRLHLVVLDGRVLSYGAAGGGDDFVWQGTTIVLSQAPASPGKLVIRAIV